MNTFLRFFYEFVSIFFDGFFLGIKGLWNGIVSMFSFNEYAKLISNYRGNFNGNEKVFLILCILILLLLIITLILLFVFTIRAIIRKFGNGINKDELLDEIGNLNEQVFKLMKEKEELMAMKVSQLGISPDGTDEINNLKEEETNNKEENDEGEIRFPRLVAIDEMYKNYKVKNYENNFTLSEFIDDFRCFSASQLGLYYDFSILRPFIAGLACGKLIILQGISGTGKTSLAYAWGKFVNKDSCVTSVEPSWREKTDFLGYFNEFSKKFNETRGLAEIYISGYDDDIHTIILDEMNLARVEYYFADLLSILEIPNKDEWLVDIVTDSWASDPKRIVNGKLKLPENLWYIGTINNDDSTFMVTDKVYDRAMPIDINTKVDPFKCREQESINVNSSYLVSLFKEAVEQHPL